MTTFYPGRALINVTTAKGRIHFIRSAGPTGCHKNGVLTKVAKDGRTEGASAFPQPSTSTAAVTTVVRNEDITGTARSMETTLSYSRASASQAAEVSTAPAAAGMPPRSSAFTSEAFKGMVAMEQVLLTEVIEALAQAAPGLPELELLQDALQRLNDLFLLVVVGEFNSGKSSLLNALLGGRWLAEGVLPTTNEISLVQYGDDEKARQPGGHLVEQNDGLFVRYLPAPLLRELHVVDTPGTNVIIERHQRLTEGYVPRADLVIFVLSADRPFSESEVRFLSYIRQWRKKVVFIVNKADLLPRPEDVDAVVGFVSSNAQRLLNMDAPTVIPVSSRAALKAKTRAATASNDTPAVWSPARAQLEADSDWASSNFGVFEDFIYNYLLGGKSEGGGEGVRLKLTTPLSVADALVEVACRKLAADAERAAREFTALGAVKEQLRRFRQDMASDSSVQRSEISKRVDEIIDRTGQFVDANVQLSRLPTVLGAIVGASAGGTGWGREYVREVVGERHEAMKAVVAEHRSWVTANCVNQLQYYKSLVEAKSRVYDQLTGAVASSSSNGTSSPAEQAPSVKASLPLVLGSAAPDALLPQFEGSEALSVVAEFRPETAAALIDAEIEDAFRGTAAAVLGAPSASLLAATYVGTTLEDMLMLAVGVGAGYVSVLNLPLRRSEVKEKAARVAANFRETLMKKMEEEMEAQVSAVCSVVDQSITPLEQRWGDTRARLEAQLKRLKELRQGIAELTQRVAEMK